MARVPQTPRQAVIGAAQGWCAYCLSPAQMMGVAFEVDHIRPRSAGGHTQLDNLCLSCPTYNRHKARRLPAPDPVSGRAVTLFHPKQDVWPHHFAWSADGAHIIGLTPTGCATVEALRFNRPAIVQLRRYWRTTGVQFGE